MKDSLKIILTISKIYGNIIYVQQPHNICTVFFNDRPMIFILFIALLCSDSIFNLLKIVADDAINKSDLENSSQYFLKDEFNLSQSR